MLIKPIVAFLTSLRLTAVLLAFSIILVFVGTIAQADEGLYAVQANYFKHWLVIGMHLFGHKIPFVLPGGYLIGTLLLVNLVATHIYRFQLSWKKAGIQLAHAGIIILLVGQLSTDILSRELQMHFTEGETRSYSDSAGEFELIFVSGNQVTAIPEHRLTPGTEIQAASLPFRIRVQQAWHNSDLNFRAPMVQNAAPLSSNGVAMSFDFQSQAEAKAMDQRNVPTVIVDLLGANGIAYGRWVASAWAGDPSLVESVRNSYSQMGAEMGQRIGNLLATPQTIEVAGKPYTFTLRPTRVYHPFSLTLLKATHTTYPGTDIPKDFRSRVRIDNSQTGEKGREVEISMNHPLRYGGFTYYQYQMDAGQMALQAGRAPSSVLQVVRNPSWLTPYIGCGMVSVGLLVQFLYHLIGFVTKRKNP
jgi:hypothetical protein